MKEGYWPNEDTYPHFYIGAENDGYIKRTKSGYLMNVFIEFGGWTTNEPIHGVKYRSTLEFSSSKEIDTFNIVFAHRVLDCVNKQKELLENYIKNIECD